MALGHRHGPPALHARTGHDRGRERGPRPAAEPAAAGPRCGEVSAQVVELSRRYGLLVDPDDRIEDLSVGMQQRVEILKLLYRGAQLLDPRRADRRADTRRSGRSCAAVLRSLVGRGPLGHLHHAQAGRAPAVADRCTVLRDGRVVGTIEDASATDKATLARMMVGRDVVLRVRTAAPSRPGAPVLEVSGLSLAADAWPGPRLAVVRDPRAARSSAWPASTATVRTSWSTCSSACASRPPGRSRISGQPAATVDTAAVRPPRRRSGPRRPASDGAGARPDRGRQPHDAGVRRPALLAPRCSSPGGIMREHCSAAGRGVRHPDARALRSTCASCPGGNQQKVVLARELDRRPKLLIAAQPTRGLDVGATEFVYGRLLDHRAAGGSDAADLDRARRDPVAGRPHRGDGERSVPARARFGRRHDRAARDC